MAEINIQKKSKPIWPWVVLLLLALVVAAFLYLNYLPEEPQSKILTPQPMPINPRYS